jgi:large conductance mechanosensitive channel
MIKGFRDFLLRGNVIALAVAVVIGAAFNAVVTEFTKGLITPIINALGGTKAVNGLGFSLRHGSAAIEAGTFINLGNVLSALINFVITAAIVYFVFVVPMNTIQERIKRGKAPEAEEQAIAPDVELLTEIRDLLKTRAPGA